MKILYTFLNFNSLTGSEIYYYELAKEMVKLGHDVTIASNCGGEITEQAEVAGIKCTAFGCIYSFEDFDIIHASHNPVVNGLLYYKFNCPLIVTCHSEILPVEKVLDHERINWFIGIREDIYNFLPAGKRSLIYNPVDEERFNECNVRNIPNNKTIFFPGTMNYLRLPVLKDLIQTYGHTHKIICTSNDGPKFKEIVYLGANWHIEDVIKKAGMVAGIIKGRTYIEAALCGKKYIDYTVDEKGNIFKKTIIESDNDIIAFDGLIAKENFYSNNVAKEIESIYKDLIKNF